MGLTVLIYAGTAHSYICHLLPPDVGLVVCGARIAICGVGLECGWIVTDRYTVIRPVYFRIIYLVLSYPTFVLIKPQHITACGQRVVYLLPSFIKG